MEKQRHREILLLGTLLIVIYTAVQHADLAWGLLLALLPGLLARRLVEGSAHL